MNSQMNTSGYTIVELLIVVSIIGVVAVGAITTISGQQSRTEFNQSIREFEAVISDVANDVVRGYFPDTGDSQECIASGAGISFQPGASVQGGSADCVFAGKALAFEPDGEDSRVAILTVAARRLTRSDRPASSLGDFEANDIRVAPQLTDYETLHYGLRVKSVNYGGNDIGTLVFMSGFSNQEQRSGGVRFSGSPQSNLQAVLGSSVGATIGATSGVLSVPGNYQEVDSTQPIEICVEHGSGGRTATVTLGKDGRQLATTTEFDTGC